MLYPLMKLKPKAMDLVYEGSILYIINKKNDQKNKLTPEELNKALDFAKNLKQADACVLTKSKAEF